jgi:hypothetical protein
MTVHCEAEWDRAEVGETRWVSKMNSPHGFPDATIPESLLLRADEVIE